MERWTESSSSSNVAFLMTDIEGSTPLWEQDPAAMERALAAHDAIIEREVARTTGRLLTHRGEGDSAFAVFSDPAVAVECAVGLQLAFAKERWATKTPIRVRIGLHVGNSLGRDAEYVQPAVNRCARLRDLAAGGQILASGDHVRAVADLPTGVSFRPLGEHPLRGLDEPIAVFQVCHATIPDDFPDLMHRSTRRGHNLPPETTSFLGREQELALVGMHLGGSRLTTLTGVGGVGKTRLALRAARAALSLFRDGVWLVDLAPLSDPRLVTNVAAAALKVPEEVGRRVSLTLDEWLANRQILIVLDNCEHLVDAAAAFVDNALKVGPGVSILATSREALRLPGEHVVVVEPLANGSALFVDRAALAGARVEPSVEVDAICEHLDGLPLAIELAASWAPVMTPAEISERLSDRFGLLSTGTRAAARKHETLAASIDWSYDLLEETERALFRRLSAFAGPFTLDAVRAVCVDDPPHDDALGVVANLVRKSLVVVADKSRRPTRYRLLETIRAYGADRLAEAGEAPVMHERLAAYVDEMCVAAERRLGVGDRDTSARLDEERANVRSALEWTRDHDPERFMRICAALTVHWANNARYSEAQMWLTAAASVEDASPEMIAKVTWGLGFILALQFKLVEAFVPFQKALEIFRRLGDERGIARCQCWLGLILAFASGAPAARPLIDEGLALARKTDDRFSLITGLYALGLVLAVYQHAPSARAVFAEGIEHARRMGDPVSVAAMTIFSGMAELFRGEYRRAHQILQESIALAAVCRAPLWISSAHTFLGGVLDQMGRHGDAKAVLEEASAVARRVGHLQENRNWHWHSRVALHRGDLDTASDMITKEAELPTSRQFLYGTLYRVQRAEVQVARGEFAAARDGLGPTIERLRENEARWALGRALLMRSEAEWGLGDRAAAIETLGEAVDVAGGFGDRGTIVDVIEWAAHVAEGQGDPASADRLLVAAEAVRGEIGYAVAEVYRPAMIALRRRIAEQFARPAERVLEESEALELARDVAKRGG